MMSKVNFLQELPSDLDKNLLPQHVAVIMDGNGRWAKKRGKARIWGHRKGVDAIKELLQCCQDWGISALTAYAFSTENWGRPKTEVDFILNLIERFLRRELRDMMAKNVQIRFLGNLTELPGSLQDEIEKGVNATNNNDGIKFNIATNYGGREEIIKACRAIASQVKEDKITIEDIDANLFESNLYTAGIISPDLLIRTSGEMRLSNFLLWQLAYTEIYVTSTLWPDFDRHEFHQALLSYQKRHRRFGKL